MGATGPKLGPKDPKPSPGARRRSVEQPQLLYIFLIISPPYPYKAVVKHDRQTNRSCHIYTDRESEKLKCHIPARLHTPLLILPHLSFWLHIHSLHHGIPRVSLVLSRVQIFAIVTVSKSWNNIVNFNIYNTLCDILIYDL